MTESATLSGAPTGSDMPGDSTEVTTMAGNGPLPQAQKRHRAKPAIPSDNLTADPDRVPPDPVAALLEDERAYFDWSWTTPAAAGWHDSDVEIVAEWARLKALVDRYLRGEVTKLTKDGAEVAAELPMSLLTQVSHREDRLYLSPLARKKGRVVITDDDEMKLDERVPANVLASAERFQKLGA